MGYKTCVSIAEKTPLKVRQTSKIALKRSDYIEVRLDFLKVEDIPKTLELIKKSLDRTVCTLRPRTEGGQFPGSEKERIAIIKLVAEYGPYLLDVEFNTIKKNAALAGFLKSTKTKLLISWHDFKKTPNTAELRKKMKDMSRFSDFIKIVSTARSTDDSARMLELYGKKGRATNLIAFAMGDFGRISRILCLYLGSPYTYVSLGRAVAPGQFSVDEVRKITDNLKR